MTRIPLDATPEDDRPASPLEAKIQADIGAMLKQHYDDLVAAPIPDQFLVLLAELEAKELNRDT